MVVFVVGCSKEKLTGTHQAQDMYISARFKDSCAIANLYADQWLILSAKFGLITPSTIIESYDLSIHSLSQQELEVWAKTACSRMIKEFGVHTSVVFLGDPEYFQEISNCNINGQLAFYIPFKYLEKNKWHDWQRVLLEHSARQKLIERTYDILFRLRKNPKQFRQFREYSGKDKLPDRGLYLYIDDKEIRIFDKMHHSRVVRVGTHAVSENSKSSLWQRLKAHLGKEDGDGNHRSSIFRSHVGTAFIVKKIFQSDTWAVGKKIDAISRQKEIEIEKAVSNYICKKWIMWIDINDFPSKFSDRAYIEQNLIALLSGYNNFIDFPSEDWLGHSCPNKVVRKSFLWNVNHCMESVDTSFVETLEKLVENTIENKSETNSVAPIDWYQQARHGYQQSNIEFD